MRSECWTVKMEIAFLIKYCEWDFNGSPKISIAVCERMKTIARCWATSSSVSHQMVFRLDMLMSSDEIREWIFAQEFDFSTCNETSFRLQCLLMPSRDIFTVLLCWEKAETRNFNCTSFIALNKILINRFSSFPFAEFSIVFHQPPVISKPAKNLLDVERLVQRERSAGGRSRWQL